MTAPETGTNAETAPKVAETAGEAALLGEIERMRGEITEHTDAAATIEAEAEDVARDVRAAKRDYARDATAETLRRLKEFEAEERRAARAARQHRAKAARLAQDLAAAEQKHATVFVAPRARIRCEGLTLQLVEQVAAAMQGFAEALIAINRTRREIDAASIKAASGGVRHEVLHLKALADKRAVPDVFLVADGDNPASVPALLGLALEGKLADQIDLLEADMRFRRQRIEKKAAERAKAARERAAGRESAAFWRRYPRMPSTEALDTFEEEERRKHLAELTASDPLLSAFQGARSAR